MAEISFDQLQKLQDEARGRLAPSAEDLAAQRDEARLRAQNSSFAANLSRASGSMVDQISAAVQGTSPIVRDVSGNDIRPFVGKFFQDAGGPAFIDQGGQPRPIDTSRHVILPDPETRELLVFERTGETDESLSSIARLFGLGALTSTAPRLATTRAVQSRAAGEVARTQGVSRETAEILRRSAVGDDLAEVRKAAREAMPADAPSLRPVLDEVTQRPGRVQTAVRRVAERAQRAGRSLTEAMNSALGEPIGLETTRRNIVNLGQETRAPAYELAYAQPINYASEQGRTLERLLRENVPPEAWRRANQIIRENPDIADVPQILVEFDDAGNATLRALPNVRQIDLLTRAIRDTVSDSAIGAMGGRTTQGAGRLRLASRIRDNLKDLVPEYAEALDVAASDIRATEALNFGRTALRRNVTRDDFALALEDMTDAERQWAMAGIRSQIDETLANVVGTMTDLDADSVAIREAVNAAKQLSSRANREKLTLLLGETQAGRLFNQIDQAATAFTLQGAIARNSATAARQVVRGGIQEAAQRGENILEMAGEGNFSSAAGRVLRGIGRRSGLAGAFGPGQQVREERIAAELADVLTRQGGAGGATAFQNIVGPRVSTQAGTRAGRVLQGFGAGQQLAPSLQRRPR